MAELPATQRINERKNEPYTHCESDLFLAWNRRQENEECSEETTSNHRIAAEMPNPNRQLERKEDCCGNNRLICVSHGASIALICSVFKSDHPRDGPRQQIFAIVIPFGSFFEFLQREPTARNGLIAAAPEYSPRSSASPESGGSRPLYPPSPLRRYKRSAPATRRHDTGRAVAAAAWSPHRCSKWG